MPPGLGAALMALGVLPDPEGIGGIGGPGRAKYMLVAANQLVSLLAGHIVDREQALLGGHLAVQQHLQQQIAQFLAHLGDVAILDGIQKLAGLLDQVPLDAVVGLGAIPRAAVRGAQPPDDLNQP